LLDLDVVTALGIIVGELVANAYDHAFPDGKGEIIVSVRRDAGDALMATITIKDNGKGHETKAENKRYGLGLVRRLVEQVHGTVTIDFDQGAIWTIRFPIADVALAHAAE
jgi:two-component sensor histidine kinase